MRPLQDTLSHACMTSPRKKDVFLKVGFQPHYLPYTDHMANRNFSFCKFKSTKRELRRLQYYCDFFRVFNVISPKIRIIF